MEEKQSVDGVILAAGSSRRAQAFKPALMLGGESMIARSIGGMTGFCRRVIVVGGYEFERLRTLVGAIPGVECVENPSYAKGMFTSVKKGLSVVRAKRCFVLPGDIPLVPESVYERLLSVDAEIVIPSFGGRTGHPVCCSAQVIPRILGEPDSSSFRDVLRAIGFKSVPVEAEEILIDIDTPGEWEALQKRFPPGA